MSANLVGSVCIYSPLVSSVCMSAPLVSSVCSIGQFCLHVCTIGQFCLHVFNIGKFISVCTRSVQNQQKITWGKITFWPNPHHLTIGVPTGPCLWLNYQKRIAGGILFTHTFVANRFWSSRTLLNLGNIPNSTLKTKHSISSSVFPNVYFPLYTPTPTQLM